MLQNKNSFLLLHSIAFLYLIKYWAVFRRYYLTRLLKNTQIMKDNLSKSAKAFPNLLYLRFVTLMTVVKFHFLNV